MILKGFSLLKTVKNLPVVFMNKMARKEKKAFKFINFCHGNLCSIVNPSSTCHERISN